MRPRLLIPAALLLLLAAAYTGWWFYATGQVRAGLDRWASDLRSRAGFAEWRDLEIGGFPLWLRAGVEQVEIRLPEGVDWRGSGIAASARPWNLREVSIDLAGDQRLVLSNGGAPAGDLTAAGGSGRLSLGRDGQPVAGRLVLGDAGLGRPGEQERLRAGRLVLEAGQPAPEGVAEPAASSPAFSLAAEDVVLPASAVAPLGREIPMVRLDAHLATPPAGLDAAALIAWASAGGRIGVDRVEIAWGPLGLSAQGEVAFDRQLRPAGVLRAEARGVDDTLDILAGQGMLRANDAAIAKAALALLSRRAPDGDPVVQASVVMQNGWLHLGPVRLAPLPPLDVLLRPGS